MPRTVAPVLPAGSLAGQEQPVIADASLVLRPWQRSDLPAVVAAYADADIRRWHLRTMTAGEAEAWVADAERAWRAERGASWAVTAPTGDLVGRVTLGALDLDGAAADVRYWVVPGARGRGVATRALVLVTEWAFAEVGLHRIELEHSTHNPGSCRVAERGGYVLEGTRRGQLRHEDGWHDMHLHARVASEAGAAPDGEGPQARPRSSSVIA